MIETKITWKNKEDFEYCIGLIQDLLEKYSPESKIATKNTHYKWIDEHENF